MYFPLKGEERDDELEEKLSAWALAREKVELAELDEVDI